MIIDNELINSLSYTMIDVSTSFISLALFFCGIGSLFYLLNAFIFPMMGGREISLEAVGRPFVLTLLLMLYPEVVGAINGIFDLTTNEMNTAVTNVISQNPYDKQAEQLRLYKQRRDSLDYAYLAGFDADKEKLEKLSTPDKNNGTTLSDIEIQNSKNQIKRLEKEQESSWLQKKIQDSLLSFVNWLTEEARDIVLLLSRILLSLIIMFGPLVIAISSFSIWKEGLVSFFSRLIGFYMWYPIALCLDLIFHFTTGIVLNSLSFYPPAQFGATLILSLIAIFTYFSIPAFAGWIVPNGGGDGGALAGIKNATSIAIGYMSGQAGKFLGGTAALSKNTKSMGGNIGSGGQKS